MTSSQTWQVCTTAEPELLMNNKIHNNPHNPFTDSFWVCRVLHMCVLTYGEKVPPLFEVFDSRQPVQHTLQPPTLGHHPRHLVHLLVILLFIYNTQTNSAFNSDFFLHFYQFRPFSKHITKMKMMYRVTCGRVQRFNELLCGVTQQASHAVDDSHWFTLARKIKIKNKLVNQDIDSCIA